MKTTVKDPFEDHEDRPSSPHASIGTMLLPTPTQLLETRLQRVAPGVSSGRSADFLGFIRPVSFSPACSKVHPGMTEFVVLEQMERSDDVKESLKTLGSGVCGGDILRAPVVRSMWRNRQPQRVRGTANNQHSSPQLCKPPVRLLLNTHSNDDGDHSAPRPFSAGVVLVNC